MEIIIIAVVLLAIPAVIYGLHRLGLYLERRGLLHYWHTKPSGGAGYNPFQELVQPQLRHVIQVEEQAVREDGEGGPPGVDGKPGSPAAAKRRGGKGLRRFSRKSRRQRFSTEHFAT
jgi:hypothetical protein